MVDYFARVICGGTAGKIIGDRIDATITSRLEATSFVAPPTKEVIAVAVRDVDNSSPVAGSLGTRSMPGHQRAIRGDRSAGQLRSGQCRETYQRQSRRQGFVTPCRLGLCASPATVEIANAVRDVNNLTPAPNSLGAAVNGAAWAGDPWATTLPGAYGANTAGNIIGNQIDVAVSSRLAANLYTAPFSLLATAEAVRDVNNQTPAANSLGAAINSAAGREIRGIPSLPSGLRSRHGGQTD